MDVDEEETISEPELLSEVSLNDMFAHLVSSLIYNSYIYLKLLTKNTKQSEVDVVLYHGWV